MSTLNVKINVRCEINNSICEKIRLSKCIKNILTQMSYNKRYMCKLYVDATCENLLFIHHKYTIYKKTDIHAYVDTY